MAVAVLNQTPHASADIITAVDALLGSGHVDSLVYVDITSLDDGGSHTTLPQIATNTTRTNYDAVNDNPVNRAPYIIGNNSLANFTRLSEDGYACLVGRMLNNWAYSAELLNPNLVGVMPPVLCTTVGRVGIDTPGTAIVFGMPNNFFGIDTTGSLSQATATLAGALAVFALQHPTFALADISAAFRQTAANWSTGYLVDTWGYGAIDYTAAAALTSPAQLYLQPPYFEVSIKKVVASYTLNPFPQTRRYLERVFVMPAGYPWPLVNELTNSDILAAGGYEIVSHNPPALPSFTPPIPPHVFPNPSITGKIVLDQFAPGSYELIAFTCDAHGRFSRVESFSRNAFTV